MSSRPFWLLAVFVLLGPVSQVMAQRPKYPTTKIDNVADILHGVKIVDPYRWLEDGNSEDVKEWVETQNQFTQAVLGKVDGREMIRKRLGTLLEIGSLGTPAPVKGRLFFTKREGEQNQAILYVRDKDGKVRALIDPNGLAKDGTVALDWWYPSRDGKFLAYGLSKDGSEQSTLYIRDVQTGKDLSEVIERTRYSSVAWLPDNSGFYYTRYPKVGSVPQGQENYNRHVFFHKLGTNPVDDPKVFGEGRPAEDMMSVQISPDGRWLAATIFQGWARSEIFIRDNHSRAKIFLPLVEKIPAVFTVTLRNDAFYVRTNHEAPRYQLYRVTPGKLDRADWQEIITEGKDVMDSVAIIGDFVVADYMRNASSRLRLFSTAGKEGPEITLPTLGTLSGLGGEWDGHEVYFGFHSFTVAPSVYRLDLKTDAAPELWGRVQTDLNPVDYQIEQVKYKSKDGTEVSMFLAHKKGLVKNGKNPTLLYGYGGFNISLTPTFAATRFLFLEKGGVLAIPNLRGGGEYGEDWHRAGMLEKKQNTFDDFLAAAEWLIDNKYTSKEKLAIQGGSNGGLLVGAAVTQRPDLFKAVVCQVPLIDMTRYHKFLIARLWIPEYGNPDDPEHFKWIHAYSPYQKVKEGVDYPALLITTAAADSRVDPLHARKMAARMQAASISSRPVLLRQETRAGHGAGKPRALILDEQTDIWSFLFWQLGMK